MTFSNPILAPANTPYYELTDLAGARLGTPELTLFGWLIYRAAGWQIASFDLERQAKSVIPSPPPLLNQLLLSGQIVLEKWRDRHPNGTEKLLAAIVIAGEILLTPGASLPF